MKTLSFTDTTLTCGYLFDKQELNRKITINAVHDRFEETGRFAAFRCDYRAGDEKKPHVFWDSDVAKWMEGVCYSLQKHPDPALEAKVDAIVAQIRQNQDANGYFNIYFTVCEPESRFKGRTKHELYCAGHLMEAAVAYAEATGKTDLLDCMERYADHIKRVFVDERSAGFLSPGHEEIELALIKMYAHTGKKKFLDLAAHFINVRGSAGDAMDPYDQSHLPVREQAEAVGHAVRAVYLYTGMARLAKETGDATLYAACKRLWQNIVSQKMYVTGGIGSSPLGEDFSYPYDLPNDTAYTETCAAIGLILFADAMLALESNAAYADVIERALYNGVLSGLSLDGKAFFYENPLEINLLEHYKNGLGERRFPITQRKECFDCSCCPPNMNRLLAALGNYAYGLDGDTLFVNQYIASTLSHNNISATMDTKYPLDGAVSLTAIGVAKVALRIPSWCRTYSINKPYVLQNGYAVVENDGTEILLTLSMPVTAVYADPRLLRNAGRICFMRGPVVYCAEAVDNADGLHAYRVSPDAKATEHYDEAFGLMTLSLPAERLLDFDGALYSATAPVREPAVLKLIPYNCFANRGECDMLVWLHT